jgi:hypothetical protein
VRGGKYARRSRSDHVEFRGTDAPRLFLDVICAKGVGSAMLGEVRRKAASLGLGIVELHALPNVIGFYRSHGFVNAPPGVCAEHADITAAAARVGKARFATNELAIADPAYARFLALLVQESTAADPHCRGVEQDDGSCSFDGYVMNRCFPITARASPTPSSAPRTSIKATESNTNAESSGRAEPARTHKRTNPRPAEPRSPPRPKNKRRVRLGSTVKTKTKTKHSVLLRKSPVQTRARRARGAGSAPTSEAS